MDFLKLLQITDSSFPLGGYAFSSGLESMAKSGLIPDLAAFRGYLRDVSDQVMTADAPFVRAAFRSVRAGDNTYVEVFRFFDAFQSIPTTRKSSLTQGRSLMKIARSAYPTYPFEQALARLTENRLAPHFAPTFGVVTAVLGVSCETALTGYLYMAVRDQIYAAVRLGMLGPNEAQRLLAEQVDDLGGKVSSAADLPYYEAYRSCPTLEIAQANHERLYTRLFQS